MNDPDVLLTQYGPLGFGVRVTAAQWNIIVTIKHRSMANALEQVRLTLATPDEIRRSSSDPTVVLFYKAASVHRWTCAVVKTLNGDGFLITAYSTEAIKEGVVIWKR
ncbi:MAG: DUF4258 domain-containing protein [SAR202 cluster bacterium]|nr:DUF4258 domain-containing protein [SAR202 cluster bacterium]